MQRAFQNVFSFLFRQRTDPFADLSVDEDQVIQCQNDFCCPASTTSEAEAYPSMSPGQSDKKEASEQDVTCVSLTQACLFDGPT